MCVILCFREKPDGARRNFRLASRIFQKIGKSKSLDSSQVFDLFTSSLNALRNASQLRRDIVTDGFNGPPGIENAARSDAVSPSTAASGE